MNVIKVYKPERQPNVKYTKHKKQNTNNDLSVLSGSDSRGLGKPPGLRAIRRAHAWNALLRRLQFARH